MALGLIVEALEDGPLSLRRLDIKLNTSSRTIRDCTTLLEELGIIKSMKTNQGSRSVTTVELTEYGKTINR